METHTSVPAVSVIVPVYKTEKYLAECIESILAQTFKNFEMILVDDGSPDNSGKICDDYAARDSRIRVFHKENGGVSSARNLGAQNARSEYLAFLDSDDFWSPKFLERMRTLVCSHPKNSLWFCAHSLFEADRNGPKVEEKLLPGIFRGEDGEIDLFDFIFERQKNSIVGNLLYFPICTGTVLIKKSEFITLGGFSENLIEGEDWKLWFECALKSNVAFYNESLFFYRKGVPLMAKKRGAFPDLRKVWSASLSCYDEVARMRPNVMWLLDRFRWLLIFRYKKNPVFRKEVSRIRNEISSENSPFVFQLLYISPTQIVDAASAIRRMIRHLFRSN